MTPPFLDDLQTFLDTAVGSGVRVLRVVVPADDTEGQPFEQRYAYERADVQEKLEGSRAECIGREALLQLWESDRRTEMFELGAVQYSVYRMDEAILMMFFEGSDRATVLSIDGDLDVDIQAIGDHLSGIIAEAT